MRLSWEPLSPSVRQRSVPSPGSSVHRSFHRTTTGVSHTSPSQGLGSGVRYVWLRDAAGNESSAYAADSILRYDDTPPSVTIRAQSPDQPAVVRVRASDSLTPLAVRELLHPPPRPSLVDQPAPRLPTATGSRRSSMTSGSRAACTSCVLARSTRLVTSAPRTSARTERSPGLRCRCASRPGSQSAVPSASALGRSGGKRRYRIVLIERPRSRFGRTIPLRGRLTSPGGNPLAGKDVEVSEQTKVPGAAWRPIATLRTSQSGRFTFRALRGPSRTLRFRFGGSRHVRGRTALVQTRRARVDDIRASRGSFVNGEGVTFRGRLRGSGDPTVRQAHRAAGVDARRVANVRDYARVRSQRPLVLPLPVLRDARHRCVTASARVFPKEAGVPVRDGHEPCRFPFSVRGL